MFSDEDIKPIHESLMRPGDEIISIREVCLNDKFDKKDLGFNNENLLSTSSKNELDTRSLYRDGFFSDGLEPQQARFAWTEEDGNIAALVSEHGFGTTGRTTFEKDLDATFKSQLKEAHISSSVLDSTNANGIHFTCKPITDSQLVSSTSTGGFERSKSGTGAYKVDKTDPRSRVHYVKYVKRHGRTVKLWECGICSREFQHQYTLMRHLPTHTDERNFHCSTCDKSFRQLSTLSQHRAIHSAERPYCCEVCNKTFNRVSTLISHRKTHSDEKPYRCHLCPKGFHQKGNLRNHLFTHTNERPYRCNICFKGFNQQSNLVCHKNKTHPDENVSNDQQKGISSQETVGSAIKTEPESSRNSDFCEVTSSVGPYSTPVEKPSDFCIKLADWNIAKGYNDHYDLWTDRQWTTVGGGVIVDPITTYHMGVALATKQTPFALLKPQNCDPVLVKVIDTTLPGGKQMLVPATAEDLRTGGKIVLKKEDKDQEIDVDSDVKISEAVQIRVPVVAVVVPRMKPGERLHLAVEEPHHDYHAALSAEAGAVAMDPCTYKSVPLPGTSGSILQNMQPRYLECNVNYGNRVNTTDEMSSACGLSPPASSPPFDLISMDLFEPMECAPLGPQITAVKSIKESPPSDDSDVFIEDFKDSIPITDSD